MSQETGARDISVRLDLESFVRRLLLFDTYILYSVRLKEIPEMVRHFGYEGTLTLLCSGALEIRCECAQFAEGDLFMPPCPRLTFQFHVIESPIRNQYVIDNLAEVSRAPGLTPRELMELQGAVLRAVRQSNNREMYHSLIAPSFESDVLHNGRLLKAAVRFVLAKTKGINIAEEFELRFHKEGDDRYRAETNLVEKLAVSADELHHTLKTALLGVAGVSQCIGEMQAHSALSGFTDEELPLFRTKLESLGDAVGSQRQERRFGRLITVASLPGISADSQIDVEKLLKIRGEPEAAEFRSWVTDLDKYNDKEIRQRLKSFNAKLGLAAQTTTGKTIRFLVQAVAGICLPVGILLTALDFSTTVL